MPRRAKGAPVDGSIGEPSMTVTAQQSRFHFETVHEGDAKEVLVRDLSISMGNREILSHADLHLEIGHHYVLTGRNGTGKSTLLKAIATGDIPSIPRRLRILLLGQTQASAADAIEGQVLEDETVRQHVVRSDKRRERLLLEAHDLSAIDNGFDSIAVVQAYRKVCHRRLEDELFEANALALRRSGARGSEARKALLDVEARMVISQLKLDQDPQKITVDELHDEIQEAARMLADVQLLLEQWDNQSALEAKVDSLLLGLGFSMAAINGPMSHLSGGWETRCSLACALYRPTDLLLLDEPTNFLDLPSIIWLEDYINNVERSTTVVVVSHDRAFADAVAEQLMIMRNFVLETFKGNLSGYEIERLKTYKYMSRMQDAQDKQKKHMKSTIEQNVTAAKRAGDDKKLKQAASRKKKLDDRMGLEVSAKGTRFKLNRDLPGYLTNMRAEIEIPKFDPPVRMSFPMTPADLRHPGALLNLEKVNFAYTKGKPVLRDIDLTIHLGDRVGIAGLNGSGKTTLVSLAVGNVQVTDTTIPGQKGITRHPRARFGLYNQHTAEEIDAIAADEPNQTALSHLLQFTGPGTIEQDARGMLSSLGLPGKYASDVPIALLSGGQKVRLALAKLLWTPPHLLILDEVTTHLDAETISGLITALRGYEGAILVVTHDRFFMRCVVQGELLKNIAREGGLGDKDDLDEEESSEDESAGRRGRVYRMSKGRLTLLEGGMQQYEQIAAKASAKLGKG